MPYGSDKLFLLNGKIETFFAGEKKHLPRKLILEMVMMSCIIAAYKNNHVCIVRKLTVSWGTRTKSTQGFSPLHYHYTMLIYPCQQAFLRFSLYASSGKRRYADQLFLLKGKHGRLYGGCPPRSLYHTHNLKSMGKNVLAQSWQKAVSRSPPPNVYS